MVITKYITEYRATGVRHSEVRLVTCDVCDMWWRISVTFKRHLLAQKDQQCIQPSEFKHKKLQCFMYFLSLMDILEIYLTEVVPGSQNGVVCGIIVTVVAYKTQRVATCSMQYYLQQQWIHNILYYSFCNILNLNGGCVGVGKQCIYSWLSVVNVLCMPKGERFTPSLIK